MPPFEKYLTLPFESFCRLESSHHPAASPSLGLFPRGNLFQVHPVESLEHSQNWGLGERAVWGFAQTLDNTNQTRGSATDPRSLGPTGSVGHLAPTVFWTFGCRVSIHPSPDLLTKVLDLCEQNGWQKPSSYQGRYNLISRGPETKLLPILRRHNISFIAYQLVHPIQPCHL